MPSHSPARLHVGIGALLCLVIINGLVTYRNIRQLHDDARAVAHTHEVLESVERVMSTMKDAETGQRGYLITGDESYLAPYTNAVNEVGVEIRRLATLTADSPQMKEPIGSLKRLAQDKLVELDQTVDQARKGDLEAARQIVRTHDGKRVMDRMREAAAAIRQHEYNLLDVREAGDLRAYRMAWLGVLAAAAVSLLALLGMLWSIRRYLKSSTEAAAALHAQRELLRATLVSIGDGVIATDPQGRITFMNSVAAKLTGWTQADALGVELDRVFQIVNESTRQPVDNPALRALHEGRIVGLANHTILIAKDGVEWPIDDSAAPITDSDGQITGAVLVFREIAERKQHEALLRGHAEELQAANQRMSELLDELRESETQFHAMVDQLPQLAWMTQPDGFIYWYNQRWYEYTGKQPEELTGWGWQSVHDPNELPRVLRNWTAALASGQAWEDTFPLRRHDGAMRWHLSRAVPWRNEQGEIQGWFGTNTDITERLQMEAALKDADVRKDEFLATLAHELRNPIAPISNALQLWPMVEKNPEEMERLRGIMERQVRQMTRLIDDLLDVSRITRGKIQLRRQSVELSTIVQGAVEAIRPLIDTCRHELQIELPDAPLHVDGDVARLTQVVGNVLQNAAKYTGHDGQIQVRVFRRDNQAAISIRDNGPGIPPDMLHRIFEMFQQVDQTLDRSHGGLGLGLTLVKRLVDLHGGTVEAHSQGAGTGSEFVIWLPLVEQLSPAPAENSAARQTGTGTLPRHRVLVVDDVRASAKTLGMMLESLGQQVTLAHDGPTAIDIAQEQVPEVVFMDIAMPGMNGYEAARRLRENPSLEGVMLVALTGYGHEEDRRRALEAGFDRHLVKPVSMDQLGELMAAVRVSHGPQAAPPAVD